MPPAGRRAADAARAAGRSAVDASTTNTTGLRPADPWRRAVARTFDVTVSWAIALWIVSLTDVSPFDAYHRLRDDLAVSTALDLGVDLLVDAVVTALAGAVVEAVWEVVPTALFGRTLGKALVGIAVVRLPDGRRPGLGRSSVRYLLPTLAGLVPGVGLLVRLACYGAAWLRADRRGWHDLLASTMVVPSAKVLRALPPTAPEPPTWSSSPPGAEPPPPPPPPVPGWPAPPPAPPAAWVPPVGPTRGPTRWPAPAPTTPTPAEPAAPPPSGWPRPPG